ncbi:alpha-amylase [Dysgonomonas sp. PH5-45]|uniref:glycoside hydrolase family 57 protein n=1 Tax=unclassified Dysgonomonas TaxID=2630389 RepID=UPI0024737F55|nr:MULTISPECIES: glycoside hydrolase family 57 protein [unclassified Dysgonomonas]MDH6354283.1 alpha-amylase [Dysgonomonas sp. PH5-45]MDH6387184.1 alpha-amylase [Dysgonomonas sp. PH5-37]
MKTICFYFQIHQPFRLKRYRFFNIGGDHYYYDDFSNEDIMQQVAETSYVPANRMLLDMIKNSEGRFKASISVSGIALEQMEIYAPEVIDGLKELAKTGCIEFLSETYAHSLVSLFDAESFRRQVNSHRKKIRELFDQEPKVFRNTELLYSDDIAELVYQMGYKGMLTEGAKRTLGWKSPNYLYESAAQPNLKLLLRNSRLSNDIAYHFSDYKWPGYPLTADKLINGIAATPKEENVFNLFMNYETFGRNQVVQSGIFEFMKVLPQFAEKNNISFSTPSQIFENYKPVDSISSTHPISWADEERDTSAWLGNILQQEASKKLYELAERVQLSQSRRIIQDWIYLQASDHFYYMGTKKSLPFSPYNSPYEAFNNYMNVLSDFKERVKAEFPSDIENEELNSLLETIHNQAAEIDRLEEKIGKLKNKNK